jgi:hypothetical protein
VNKLNVRAVRDFGNNGEDKTKNRAAMTEVYSRASKLYAITFFRIWWERTFPYPFMFAITSSF